jgi:hypothetical protein
MIDAKPSQKQREESFVNMVRFMITIGAVKGIRSLHQRNIVRRDGEELERDLVAKEFATRRVSAID